MGLKTAIFLALITPGLVAASELGTAPIKRDLFDKCYNAQDLDSCAKLAFYAKDKKKAQLVLIELCKAHEKYCFDLLDFADANNDVLAQGHALSNMCAHGNKVACGLIVKNLGGADI